VTIHNFRSVCDLSFDCRDLMVLLGPNNHGKSNILRAIGFALTPGEKVTRDDLFSFCSVEDSSIWVELTFSDLTTQESRTFEKYVRPGGTVKIRKSAVFSDAGTPVIEYRGYVQEPEEWWLKASAYERLSTKSNVADEAMRVPQLRELEHLPGKLTKANLAEFQTNYIRDHFEELTLAEALEDGPLLGLKSVAGGVLPEFHVVPAVRDLTDETKTKSTTMFGRLLQRAIREMAERDQRFGAIQDEMSELVEQLNDRSAGEAADSELAQLEKSLMDELGDDWDVELSVHVDPPNLNRVFELGTSILIDDGVKTGAEQKGHGLQRALVFALVKTWASVLRRPSGDGGPVARKASDSIVFAIEEPELYLHPQAQRQLAHALADLASIEGHQVFLCTHSTHFVDLDDYGSIAVISREQPCDGSGLRQCKRELFAGDSAKEKKNRFHMASWINPDRSELFFARRVILVEGETEKAILPFIAERLNCLDATVSVIDCGSKFNLPLYVEVCEAFELDYFVIHDADTVPNPVPADWGAGRAKDKAKAFAFNSILADAVSSPSRIWKFDPDFEGVCGISSSQGHRKGKAIAALDHLTSLDVDGFPNELVTCVRLAYAKTAKVDAASCPREVGETTSNA
jgi:putative ATP-dependent endonuclease of OLD family